MKMTEDVTSLNHFNHCKVVTLEERLQLMQGPSYAGAAQSKPPATAQSSHLLRPQSLPRRAADKAMKPAQKNGDNTQPKVLDDRPSIWAEEKSQPPKSLLRGAQSLISLSSSRPSLHEEGFGYDRKERRRRHRKVIKGCKRAGGLEAAPEASRDVFIYRLSKRTTEEDIAEFMADNNMKPRAVTKVSHCESTFASFKVEVKASLLKTVLDPESWPENVCVRR